MTSKTGKSYMGRRLTDEAREWREMVGILAHREMKRLSLSPIVREKFSLDCIFYWRDLRSQFDCDNLLKMLQDSMVKVVYSSDKLCVPRVVDFAYDAVKPRIELTVSNPPTTWLENLHLAAYGIV